MKILVIGGSGFIGSHVLGYLSTHDNAVGTFFSNAQIAIPGCDFEPMDVRNRTSVMEMVDRIKPTIIIQVCGTKSIEFCQANPGEARMVHTEGTRNVVEACLRYGIRLAYVSTDCIFDGNKSSYTEEDPTRPFNVYGRVKRDGEEIIQNSGLNAIVIRTSLLFGWRRNSCQVGNFVISVYDTLKSRGSFDAPINLFNTPLEISPAAQSIAELSLSRYQGIFHVAGNTRISRYDFAVKAADILGPERSSLRPITDISGLRQPNSCLSVSKTEAILNIRFEDVEEGLRRMALQSFSKEV
jgi:dTDP-4-dehydrorhamnose reductase